MDEASRTFTMLLLGSLLANVIIIIFNEVLIKKIPKDTQKKIDQPLNDRSSYETTNHNFVMNALSPNNEHLSTEHRVIQQELGNIKESIISMKEKRNVDYSIVDNAGKSILQSIDNLSNFSNAFVTLTKTNQRLEKENKSLTRELEEVKQAYNQLQKQTKARDYLTHGDMER